MRSRSWRTVEDGDVSGWLWQGGDWNDEGKRGGLACEGDMATVVVMVLVTVWEVVSELATSEAAERRAKARMDLVCMVDGGLVIWC